MIDLLLSTYNGERFLREQLDSLLAQTYTDWHLSVRDDGSVDGTLAILEEYCTKYPSKISLYQDELGNVGVKRSFEELLCHCATGDYLMFCDQDDVWLPHKIARFHRELCRMEEEYGNNVPLLVHGDMCVVDCALKELHPSFWEYSNLRPDLLDDNVHFLGISNDITGCSCAFNQAARRVTLPFNLRTYMHDAWLGVSVLAHGGKITPIYEPTMLYRQHGSNTLGALEYTRSLMNWKFRWKLARQSYANSHPLVFKHVLSFVWWKLCYVCMRIMRKRSHDKSTVLSQ